MKTEPIVYTVKVFSDRTEWRNSAGQLHREDGPAIEYSNGTKSWYRNDRPHREGSPAVEYADGTKSWYRNGELHREDGPAHEWANGTKSWYRNGELHREDGPAREWANGTKSWYLNGEPVSEADVMKNHRTIEIDGKQFTMTQLKMLIEKAGA
jgi:antitoxin component YwqK of YwqJK toxin-antitoxin module